jgi:uncharacterized membrane protein
MVVILILLPAIGLYISTYFTLVYYGILPPDTRWIPSVCRMEKGACQLVIRHPDAKVFGVPNSLLAICYYTSVLALGLGVDFPIYVSIVEVASWATVLLAVYLIYSLFFKVKVVCPLCLVSHAINLVLAIVITLFR